MKKKGKREPQVIYNKMNEILLITYKTIRGNEMMGKFIRTYKGLKPIFIEDGYLTDDNEILEEKEIDVI